MRRTKGFTLIELLVVVAIISILIAILMPSLSRARESSRRVKCLSTLRQFSMASLGYASEWQDWAVPLWQVESGTTRYWVQNDHFRKSLNLAAGSNYAPLSLICPNATLAINNANAARMAYISYSYGYNTTNIATRAGGTFKAQKINGVTEPASIIQFADGLDILISWAQSNQYFGEVLPPSPNQVTAYRHLDGVNVAFWDGHGEWLPRTRVSRRADVWDTTKQ